MVINLTSQLPTTESFQIQVVQEDLDKDTVTFTRDITLNAATQEKYWVYFLPQPTTGGLPGGSLADLQKVLKVYLCAKPDSSGHAKQLMRLPLSLTTLSNLDPSYGEMEHSRGRKLVLFVTEGDSQPAWREYDGALGTTEDVVMVRVGIADLPENVLGYDSVDAILWLAARADKLDEAGSRRKEAIEQFVRGGGQLVVCAPAQPHDIDALADLLPIDPREVTMVEHKSLAPLSTLAAPRNANGRRERAPWVFWDRIAGSNAFKFAKATPGEKALVEDWIDWPGPKPTRTPWLARRAVGLGSVTWVAQDLGDPALKGIRDARGKIVDPSIGWPYVWDHVFGWNNATRVGAEDDNKMKDAKAAFDTGVNNGYPRDLGKSLFSGITFEGKGAGLMGIAILFFIVYWIVAGPGSFLYLSARSRKHWSWFAFGAAAIIAAGLTIVLVRLILRGNPVVQHVSVVQMAAGEHTRIRSRIGLYVPRDGDQTIELDRAAPDAVSAVTASIVHPQDVSDNEFPAAQDYTIPVHDAEQQTIAVKMPFRSTLKKVEARWVGDMSGGFLGLAKLTDPRNGYIIGSLTNQTGVDLRNVYFAFNHPQTGVPADWVLYVPFWKNGQTLDLNAEYNAAKGILTDARPDGIKGNVKGTLAPLLWPRVWYQAIAAAANNGDDSGSPVQASFPVMSLVDRLPPPVTAGKSGDAKFVEHCFDLIRRGGRDLNRSGAVAAGQLVVLAESRDVPLPLPLKVDGQDMTGEGKRLYQAVLPLDRSGVEQAPSTQPVDDADPPG